MGEGEGEGGDIAECSGLRWDHWSGLLPNRYVEQPVRNIPYSTTFSRHIKFAVFADWPQTATSKLTKCFVVYTCIRSILSP